MTVRIAPSVLSADLGRLPEQIERAAAGGAEWLHIDVMDGHFVPNLSYGPMVIERMRRLTELPFDAHLMITEPARYLDDYLDAGCNLITFHVEAVDDAAALLHRIRQAGAAAGVALNPGTPVTRVLPLLGECDLVLVMSVEPGFGGQKFMPASLGKLEALRSAAPPEVLLSIDGGIGPDTIAAAARAGAGVFVVGSAIFDAKDYGQAVSELAALAGNAPAGHQQ
jgi:ribulose-phosphate 3-epimerase